MLNKILNTIQSSFKYFTFFYGYLKIKLLVVILFSFLVSLLDALSISIFIPLLNTSDKNKTEGGQIDEYSKHVQDFLHFLNIPNTINYLLLVMLVFFILKGVFRYLDVHYRVFLISFFVKNIRSEQLNLISHLRYSKFVKTDLGKIQNSITKECDNVVFGYTQYISVFQNAIFVIVYLILSLFVNPKFSIIVIFGGIVSNLIFRKVYVNSENISFSISNKNNHFMSLVLQHITNFKYLKATNRAKDHKKMIENVMHDIEDNQMKLGFISGLSLSLREPLLVLFLVGAIFLHINYFNGDIASILLILILLYRTFSSLMTVQTNWTGFLKYVGSIRFIKEVKKEFLSQQEIIEGKLFKSIDATINVKNLSYSYNNEQIILNQVSLTIPANSSVAFVGRSGSGKTTLINLLIGLLEPTNGSISIDGVSLKEYNIESYRGKVGLITQEVVVFNDTLFNNVTFWDEKNEKNLTRFYEIIEKVDLTEFINNFNEKEDLILGDNGVLMSGGQRQRLSIARELYKENEILVLDEATSALDTETEKIIQQSIDALKGSVTIIIIAHRLSTIKNVDTIYLLNNGTIEASGSFNELLSQSTTFANMVKTQEL